MKDHTICLNLDEMPLLECAAFWRASSPFIHEDRILNFHVADYLVSGRMQIIEDGQEYILTPGSLLFLKGGVHHWGTLRCTPGTSWYYAHFHLSQMASVPSLASRCPQIPGQFLHPEDYCASVPLPKFLPGPAAPAIEQKLRHLTDCFHSSETLRPAYLNLALYEFLLECAKGAASQTGGASAAHVRRITEYLEAHLAEPLNTDDLASCLGLSYKYLGALFKEASGRTILEYHTMLRMNEAARLLRETALSVSAISERLGYADPYYFSNVFKKVFRRSPRDYRNAIPGSGAI